MSRRMSDYRKNRSIVVDSGPLVIENGITFEVDIPYIGNVTVWFPGPPNPVQTMNRNRLNGFTPDQWNWIQDTAESQDHVFFFTHGRIVGGGDEQKGRLVDHTEDFVQWANQDDVNVEAVFCGHTHENNKFGEPYPGKIESDEIADPDDFTQNTIPFDWYTVYIETEEST